MSGVLVSLAEVVRGLVTYTDWWQPVTASILQVGAARRSPAFSDGVSIGLWIGSTSEPSSAGGYSSLMSPTGACCTCGTWYSSPRVTSRGRSSYSVRTRL